MRIITYRDLCPGRFTKPLERLRAGLGRDDFAAAGLKKLAPTPYWRAKLSDEARLLMQFVPYNGETVCLFLEVIPDHAYEKSRFLRGASVDRDKIEAGPHNLAPQPEPSARSGWELKWLPPEAVEFDLARVLQFSFGVVGCFGSGPCGAFLIGERDRLNAAFRQEWALSFDESAERSPILALVGESRADPIAIRELSPDHDPQAAIRVGMARLGRENAEVIDIAAEGVGDVLRAPIVLVEPGREQPSPGVRVERPAHGVVHHWPPGRFGLAMFRRSADGAAPRETRSAKAVSVAPREGASA